MIDDRWMPPLSPLRSPPSPASVMSARRAREHLTDRERILALEMTDDHHEELHRQTAHRLEMGDHRMDHIEDRIGRIREQQVREATVREARAAEKAASKAARNHAIQMVVWGFAILTGVATLWNVATQRAPQSAPAITAPAPR